MGSQAKRLAAAALALSLAAVSATSYVSWRRGRDQLLELLAEVGTGAREPGVVSDVRREPDKLRARLLVARALLADEIDRRWLSDLTEAEREAAQGLSLHKLETASALAQEVLERQPASWQARMILAGSTYLEMSRIGDPARWRDRFRWEQPLRDAMAMATSQVEPRRILAAAYLNDWSLMTTAERDSARDVLRVAFRDRATLEQLLPTWLRRAQTLDQAFDLIPADTTSWKLVEKHFRAQRDWERVCKARARSLGILPEYLEKRLAEAEQRLAGGDPRIARQLALHALAETPIGPDHSEILERILRALPPGPIQAGDQQRTKDWLAWARRECLLGSCPLPGEVLQRLRALSQYETSADRAWAAELAGDTYSAESHEREALVPNTPEWTPYLSLKAKRLAAAGHPGEAAALLTMIDRDSAERATTKAVQSRVAKSLGLPSRDPSDDWQGATIRRKGDASIQELFWQDPPEKVRLRFGSVASGGAAVQILWSDQLEECHEVGSGAILTLRPPRSSGFQILEARPLPGSRIELVEIRVLR